MDTEVADGLGVQTPGLNRVVSWQRRCRFGGLTGQAATPQKTFAGFRLLPRRPPVGRRLGQLLPGLVLFGIGLAFSIEADLGTNPWTVFHTGAADRIGFSVGTLVILTGLVLLLSFVPFREPLGLGTVLNVAVIGPVVDIALAVIPDLTAMPARLLAIGVAPICIGLASGLYIGAGLGPGPRDGIMTALERRGMKVSIARTIIELTALALGALLGGKVGFGTVYMALTVGIWVQFFLRRLRIDAETT